MHSSQVMNTETKDHFTIAHRSSDMRKQNIPFLLILFLIGNVMIAGQRQTRNQNSFYLQDPRVIKIELLPRRLRANEEPRALAEPYKVGARIHFRIQATNTSLAQVTVPILNSYFQNRPELLRGGQVVPYKEGLDEILKGVEDDPFMGNIYAVKLNPNESKIIGYLFLDDWYKALQPGHYQLSLKHRFNIGQDWIESSSITFEVVPKNPEN